MKIIICSSFLVIVLFSCNNRNEISDSKTENKDHTVIQTQSPVPPSSKGNRHTLLSNIKTHLFSDSLRKDTFKLALTGDSLRAAKAIFSIITYEGKKIYTDTFSGEDLTMNVDGDAVISDSEKLANIRKSVRTFFSEKKFSKPPFFEQDGNPTDSWDELKLDKSAIGFEEVRNHKDFRIAYFKNRHEVLTYWDDDMAGD